MLLRLHGTTGPLNAHHAFLAFDNKLSIFSCRLQHSAAHLPPSLSVQTAFTAAERAPASWADKGLEMQLSLSDLVLTSALPVLEVLALCFAGAGLVWSVRILVQTALCVWCPGGPAEFCTASLVTNHTQ